MINALFVLFSTLVALVFEQRDLMLEILALRQQLIVYKRLHPRPQLRHRDRLFWVWLSKLWGSWRQALVIVQPETARRLAPPRVQILLDEVGAAKKRWSATCQCQSQSFNQADGRS